MRGHMGRGRFRGGRRVVGIARRTALLGGVAPSAVAGLTPVWVFSTTSVGDETGFNSTPVVYDGCVYVASFGGTAYALDARTGHVIWQRKLEASNPGSGGVVVGAEAISG